MIIFIKLSKCNLFKLHSMKNQDCKVRPEIINVNSNEPVFYPFSFKTSKCSSSCNNINDPYTKMSVPDVVKDFNVKVFNLMSKTNETISPENIWFFCFFVFFYLAFAPRIFTIHRTAGEGGGYLLISFLPLSPISQTLRHYLGYCYRELTSVHSWQPELNMGPWIRAHGNVISRILSSIFQVNIY